MKTPTEIISAKLQRYYADKRGIEEQQRRLTDRARIVDASIEALESVQSEMEKQSPADSNGPDEHHDAAEGAKGPGPTDAVVSLLMEHPEGLPRGKIVEELAAVIQSGSSDKRRLLFNTIINLVKRGTARVDRDGFGNEVIVVDGARNGEEG